MMQPLDSTYFSALKSVIRSFYPPPKLARGKERQNLPKWQRPHPTKITEGQRKRIEEIVQRQKVSESYEEVA